MRLVAYWWQCHFCLGKVLIDLTPSFLAILLTAWCRILFEKLIVTQLVKEYPALFMEPKGSSPCSQRPSTGPYPEPAESSSFHWSSLTKTILIIKAERQWSFWKRVMFHWYDERNWKEVKTKETWISWSKYGLVDEVHRSVNMTEKLHCVLTNTIMMKVCVCRMNLRFTLR
jgi:hypothetical protein